MGGKAFEGFIIYPTYRVEDGKAYVYLYGRVKTGESFCTKNYYKPYFYIKKTDLDKAKQLGKFDYSDSNLKSFTEEPLLRITMNLPKEVGEFRKQLEEIGVDCYEADIRFAYRYMMDKDLKGSIQIKGDPSEQRDVRADLFFDEPELSTGNWNPENKDLKILSTDIETSIDGKNLYCVSLCTNDNKLDEVLIVSEKKGLKKAKTYSNEKELLEEFRKKILEYDPDIITGWNLIDFDFKFLEERMKQLGVNFDLGRTTDKCSLRVYESFITDSKADFPGRLLLDGIHLLKTSFVRLDDYKLGTAAKSFAKKTKLIEDENKGEDIEKAYKEDQQKLVDYNLLDSKLVLDIIKNSGAMQLTIQRSLLTGMPLDRVRASIASLDSLYLRELRKRGYAAISSKYSERGERTTGGYVMDPKPGFYEYVTVMDFKSLYPSIMRTFNIDPLMYRPGCKEVSKGEGLIKAPNGACFSKKPGILPVLLENLWQEREKARNKGDELTRGAIKILMNSMYGVLASPNCRFYSFEMANAITSFGHKLIKEAAKKLESKGFKVIYGDSVGGDTKIIVRRKGKISEEMIRDLFEKPNEFSKDGKEYNFKKELEVLTLDRQGKSVFKKAPYVMRHNTRKKMYRVSFTNNWSIDVTEDHSLIAYQTLAFNNSKKPVLDRLIEIKPDEISKKANSIITLKKIPNAATITKNYPKEVYEFMGYFVGDGSFRRNNSHNKYNKDYYLGLSLGKDAEEVFEKLVKPLIKKGYIKNYWWSNTRKGDLTINGLKLIAPITKYFRDEKGKKKIPEWLQNEKEVNIKAFLRGLFSADGSVMLRHNIPIIKYTSTKDEYIEAVRKLLYFSGISHSVFKENNVNKYKGKKKVYSTGSYSKNIIIKNKNLFAQKIGFILERKNELAAIKSVDMRRKRIKDYEFDLQQVKKIEQIEKQEYVYDIEVEGTHRFFANYVLVHNTDSVFAELKVKSRGEAEKLGGEIQEELNGYYKKKLKTNTGLTASSN